MEGDREAMRERFKEGRGRMKEMAEAFVSDSFDARSFGFGERIEKMAGAGSERFLRVAAVALPILTSEQRSKLADIVEGRLEKRD